MEYPKKEIWLNQNDSKFDGWVPAILLLGFLFILNKWQLQIPVGIIMIASYYTFIKLKTVYNLDKKEINVQKPFFKQSTYHISEINSINYIETTIPSARNSVELKTLKKGRICNCFNMQDEEYEKLFNDIYGNVNLKRLKWNKEMEDFEPFQKSSFGELINTNK